MYYLKIFLVVAFVLFINQSIFAQNCCLSEVKNAASSMLTKHTINSVIKTDVVLAPGEEALFWDTEIWNYSDSDTSVEVYLVNSSFMASFKHAFLVNPTTCDIEKVIEVYFE